MAIIFFAVGETAQVGEFPRRNKLVSSDNYSVLTQPGYLSNSTTSGKQVFPTDIIDVLYNYTGTSSFNSASAFGTGTYQQFVPVFNSGVITLSPVSFVTVQKTITQSQILNMHTTNIQLVAPQGANTLIMGTICTAYINFQITPFSGGGTTLIQFGNVTAGDGLNALQDSNFGPDNLTGSVSVLNTFVAPTNYAGQTNLGIYMGNDTAPFTGGSAKSTILVSLTYQVVLATI